VSRPPVREAILKLSDEGLLEIYPQSGIFVSRIPVAALPEAIIIRKALEETTARLAAERATSSQILALQSILERQREASAAGDRDTFHQADEMFHATKVSVDEVNARHLAILLRDVYGADDRDLCALAVAGAAEGVRVLEQAPQFAG
jgi:DNA-binding GntR family transcriptional regulator